MTESNESRVGSVADESPVAGESFGRPGGASDSGVQGSGILSHTGWGHLSRDHDVPSPVNTGSPLEVRFDPVPRSLKVAAVVAVLIFVALGFLSSVVFE